MPKQARKSVLNGMAVVCLLFVLLIQQNTAAAQYDFYICPDSSSAYLTEEAIRSMPLQAINYAKNEIYARLGRRFNSPELQGYFDSQSWYNGTISPSDFNEGSLNTIERYNAELLRTVEFSMNPNGYPLDVPGYSYEPVYEFANRAQELQVVDSEAAVNTGESGSEAEDAYPSGRWVTNGNSGSVEVQFSADTVYYYQYDFSDTEHKTPIDTWEASIGFVTKNGEEYTVIVNGANGDYMFQTNPDDHEEMWRISLPDNTYSGSDSIRRKAASAAVPASNQTSSDMAAFLESLRAGISGYTWQTVNGSTLSVPRAVAITDLNQDGAKDVVAVHTENYSAYVDLYVNENGNYQKVLSDTLSGQVGGGVFSLVFLSFDPNARVQIYTVSAADVTSYFLSWYSFDGNRNLNLINKVGHFHDDFTGEDWYSMGDSQSISSEQYYQYLNSSWNSREEVLIYDNYGGRLERELGSLPEMSAVALDQAKSGLSMGSSPDSAGNTADAEEGAASFDQILHALEVAYADVGFVSMDDSISNGEYYGTIRRNAPDGTHSSAVFHIFVNAETLEVSEGNAMRQGVETFILDLDNPPHRVSRIITN